MYSMVIIHIIPCHACSRSLPACHLTFSVSAAHVSEVHFTIILCHFGVVYSYLYNQLQKRDQDVHDTYELVDKDIASLKTV